jgi:hypothetical protein
MTHKTGQGKSGVSPSEFMRNLRPELYSDSTERRQLYELDGATLEYHLDTITSRNQTHAFETFCRKLCERTVCPNLRPATGPEGGGDSKADSETLPLADELADLLFFGEANAGRERWAFAFSAKKRWTDKARADVASAIGTGRDYQKVFFVTSQFARSKDRARLEDELTREHGAQVTILDRSWIVEQVIDHDHRDLAVNYLNVGTEVRDGGRLGPSDYSRAQQLEDLERSLVDPEAFQGMALQRVSEALVAAKLSRSLERPRIQTDGRFARAIRLALSEGSTYQQLEAQYESLWTAFWWFDDLALVNREYANFEARVLPSDHAKFLEMLCNLLQLLFNATLHKQLAADDTDVVARASRLRSRLAAIAEDKTRPNNALEATTSALLIDLNSAVLAGNSEGLSSLWPQFSAVLDKAEGLGEFDATRAINLIKLFGQIAGSDPAYSKLYDQLVDFVSKRKSEAEGALLLLDRARQLDFDRNFEMIRLLGRAVCQLTKREHSDSLAEATQLLALAYRSAGLLWAARAICLFAVATMFIDAEEGSDLPASVIPTVMMLAWISVELHDIPESLQAVRLARGCANGLPLTEDSQAHFAKRLEEFDLVFSYLTVNMPEGTLQRLESLPNVLLGLGLPNSRTWLLYALGHEPAMRAEGSIPEEESPDAVLQLACRLAAQMPPDQRLRPFLLNGRAPGECVTLVSGVRIAIKHCGSVPSMLAAESIASALEVVFATLPERDVFAHVQSFELDVLETSGISEPGFSLAEDQLSATVSWPDAFEPATLAQDGSLQRVLIEIATRVVAATCSMRSTHDTVKALFETDAVAQRVSSITIAGNSRNRVFGEKVASLDKWTASAPKTYPLQAVRPRIVPLSDAERRPRTRAGTATPHEEEQQPPRPTDHRLLSTLSVIDIALWNQARWRGVAFFDFGPGRPPAMGLMFDIEGAARAIFERWRGRFGERDSKDSIFVGIVRGISNTHPTHYRVLITSALPDPDESGPDSRRLTTVASRIQTMEPETSENLDRFLSAYQRTGVYWLAPVVLQQGGKPDLLADLAIFKQAVSIKAADEIGRHDIEIMALHAAHEEEDADGKQGVSN